ncbi:MAG TPA: hypothetical protein VFI23_01225 [Rhizomicrobium sp.]|nr:hypothetical protein [Rhizomicrobium sp.]
MYQFVARRFDSRFVGGRMGIDNEMVALADVLMHDHGVNAESVADQNARRCALQGNEEGRQRWGQIRVLVVKMSKANRGP